MDLIDDDAPARGSNVPTYTVSELSGEVKRMVEGQFAFVRVRGEIGRVSRPSSGHLYFDLKDGNSVLAAIAWKGPRRGSRTSPRRGSRLWPWGAHPFAGQSKYQMTVEDLVARGRKAR
jgi:exodeoxyribonuclease VII large subunit